MTRNQWIAVAVVGAIFALGIVGVEAASRYLSAEARALRECPASYWVCESEVVAQARILEQAPPSFDAEARACVHHQAWENAVYRAMFDCQVSPLVESGSCLEHETTCEITRGS